MGKRVAAIVLIYLVTTLAWVLLGGSVYHRTYGTDDRLHQEVSGLWGDAQTQLSPELKFTWPEKKVITEKQTDPATKQEKLVTRESVEWADRPVILDRSSVVVDLRMDQRKKGLLWYSTYGVGFQGDYSYTHDDPREGMLIITYRFPTPRAIYDDFRFEVNGKVDPKVTPVSEENAKIVQQKIPVTAGGSVPFKIAYRSRGLDSWRYSFGCDVNRVKNFTLAMTTDFDAIDFPQGTISPTMKEPADGGWRLQWKSANLISGFQIGMDLPRKLNPGPLAAEISFFAPVSLAFFFAWMFVITLLKRVDLHPMNYLFLGAAFFSFHLLLCYTVDHIDLVGAFLLASGTSLFLVVSYLRLVVGLRFAAIEAGFSQLIYLVLFSYAHFFEGFTGLIVTIGSILTLFALMQLTGRVRWSDVFPKGVGSRVEPLPEGR